MNNTHNPGTDGFIVQEITDDGCLVLWDGHTRQDPDSRAKAVIQIWPQHPNEFFVGDTVDLFVRRRALPPPEPPDDLADEY